MINSDGSASGEVITPPPIELLDSLLAVGWWYHQMDLGSGRITPGGYGDNLIPVVDLLSHVNVSDMRCLDIGTMDGKMAFLMESLGGRVLAVDGVKRDTITALSAAFRSSVRYRSGVLLEQLPELAKEEGLFDLVLCSGVAYHVYSPFDLFANVRRLLRNGGLAIIETAAIVDDNDLFMSLNHGDHYFEHTTLWIPSTACVRYMLRFLSMRVLGESRLTRNDYHVVRQAWLVQADRPSVLAREAQDPWLATLLAKQTPGESHERLRPQLDHQLFETQPQSGITAGPVTNRTIRHEEPHSYREQTALLQRGTPAWRLL